MLLAAMSAISEYPKLQNEMIKQSRRNVLRQLTSQNHEALEELVGPIESLADYKRYLIGISGFRLPLERDFSEVVFPEFFGVWRPQQIGDLLIQDAADLELVVKVTKSVSELDSAETMLGKLYVLEGSSLGANIILKQVATVGLNAEYGARHLARQTCNPTRWRQFIEILDQHPQIDIDRVADASLKTFSAAQRSFEEVDALHG